MKLEALFMTGGLLLLAAAAFLGIGLFFWRKSGQVADFVRILPVAIILGIVGLWLTRSIIEQWANI